ncbi:MAG TPA: efflux RND transporter periplasmic adaptor subunit [Ramlibacter sp.]|nr:efflux RND transporter periplasmic adaptor subunit [Ramlibacter sp.]
MSHESHSQLAIHPVDGSELLKRQQVARRVRIVTIVVLVLLALGAARTLVGRMSNAKALEAVVKEGAILYVKTTTVANAKDGQTLVLPGTLQGFVQAPVAARAGGYLKRWTRDIGARVQKGELLAEIETPEIDQQLTQAIAARQQAASSLELARTSAERWEALRKRDAVSQQELEERRSGYTQARANLAAADANVERLRELTAFKRVVAPFAGVITRRNVDIGDLIDTSGKPLFLLAQTDPLRVYVNVPQSYAQLVRTGQPVVVTQAELQGRSFKGQVARTAASIDAASRTMQVEVALPNRDGALLPGAFVQVALALAPSDTLSVPANVLMFRSDGTRVARVDEGGKVHLQPVRLGRNYGETVEILEGLRGNERLVLNPSDALAEGDLVQVATDTPPRPAKGAP